MQLTFKMISYYHLEGDRMVEYKELYYLLFNGITDAIEQINKQNVGTAKDLLIRVQQEAEERYISEAE